MSSSQAEFIKDLIKDLKDLGLTEYHWTNSFRQRRDGELLNASVPVQQGGLSIIWQKELKARIGASGGQSRTVAVKVVNGLWSEAALRNEERTKQMCKYLKREFRIWKRIIPHSNIAGLMGFVVEVSHNEFPGFLMPWYDNTSARYYLEQQKQNKEPVQMPEKLKLLRDVIVGLEYLHSQNVVHRDLTGRNVLLDINKKAYLADFGSAKLLLFNLQDVTRSSAFSNNLNWTPPEYIRKDENGAIVPTDQYHNPTTYGDIWSFGCLFYEVLRVADPYQPHDAQAYLTKGRHPPLSSSREEFDIEPKHQKFMERECWASNPHERISAAKIIERMDGFLAAITPAGAEQR